MEALLKNAPESHNNLKIMQAKADPNFGGDYH